MVVTLGVPVRPAQGSPGKIVDDFVDNLLRWAHGTG
jgi:hypothetical protein